MSSIFFDILLYFQATMPIYTLYLLAYENIRYISSHSHYTYNLTLAQMQYLMHRQRSSIDIELSIIYVTDIIKFFVSLDITSLNEIQSSRTQLYYSGNYTVGISRLYTKKKKKIRIFKNYEILQTCCLIDVLFCITLLPRLFPLYNLTAMHYQTS